MVRRFTNTTAIIASPNSECKSTREPELRVFPSSEWEVPKSSTIPMPGVAKILIIAFLSFGLVKSCSDIKNSRETSVLVGPESPQ